MPHQTSFLSFPAELRLKVYQYICPINAPISAYQGLLLSCKTVYSEASVEIIKNSQAYHRALEARLTDAISEPVTISLPEKLASVSNLSITLGTRPMIQSSNFYQAWKTHIQPLHFTRITLKPTTTINEFKIIIFFKERAPIFLLDSICSVLSFEWAPCHSPRHDKHLHAKAILDFFQVEPGSLWTDKKRGVYWERGYEEEPNALVWRRWKGNPKTTTPTKTGLLSGWWATVVEYLQKLDVVMYYK